MTYTTGELARLCGVSVRTVQYYDSRGILVPDELSEGGRRLYSDEDLDKLKIICFLRDMEFSIDSIKKLLEEEDSEDVITMLLEQQESILKSEIALKEQKLSKLLEAKKALSHMTEVSYRSLGDAVTVINGKKQRRRVLTVMLCMGIPVELGEFLSVALWVAYGIWWPFVLWAGIAVIVAVFISLYYYNKAAFICPRCHTVFKPNFGKAFFARHTPNTRDLTCPECSRHGFCVEIYNSEE